MLLSRVKNFQPRLRKDSPERLLSSCKTAIHFVKIVFSRCNILLNNDDPSIGPSLTSQLLRRPREPSAPPSLTVCHPVHFQFTFRSTQCHPDRPATSSCCPHPIVNFPLRCALLIISAPTASRWRPHDGPIVVPPVSAPSESSQTRHSPPSPVMSCDSDCRLLSTL
jgi:hypothetical protein